MNQALHSAPDATQRKRKSDTNMRWLTVLLFSGVMALSACGPYRSGAALQDVEAVRTTVAELERDGRTHRRAKYTIAKGDAFLLQARLSAGHSDHTGAIEFAQIARESFIQARILLESVPVDKNVPVSKVVPTSKPADSVPATAEDSLPFQPLTEAPGQQP